jgi:hypothetical protein
MLRFTLDFKGFDMPTGVYERRFRSLKDRLMEKVSVDPKTGCWNWTGTKSRGYGYIKDGNAMRSTHRVSYEFHCGCIADGMYVCHRCDNRACLNPDHLFLGTSAENMADMVAKGRQARQRGTSHGRAKLSDNDVRAIRAASGVTHRELAERFGVGQALISFIRNRKLWSHI